MSENDGTAAELLELGAATLGESGGHAMRARIRAAWPGARLAAPAFPVHCTPGDNLAIHVAVAEAPAGSALVVDVGDVPELGYWGEVLTTGAESRGLAGLVIDGSGTVKRSRSGPDRLSLGAKFGMAMLHWVPYPIMNEVVEFEEGRRIAWQHIAHDVWRYELEPQGDRTLVRETFDWSHGRGGKLIEMMGVPKQNLASMEKTLERLAAHVENGPPGS
jgi:hypothetical protein